MVEKPMMVERSGRKPIDSAPFDQDVTLLVSDGYGKPCVLKSPFRLTSAGWISSGKGTPLAVAPLQWRLDARPRAWRLRPTIPTIAR
jgi:hypothetical protein